MMIMMMMMTCSLYKPRVWPITYYHIYLFIYSHSTGLWWSSHTCLHAYVCVHAHPPPPPPRVTYAACLLRNTRTSRLRHLA